MNIKRLVNPRAVGAEFFFLLALPALICGQASTPPPTQIPPRTSPPARANQPAPTDIFAGLQYTEDQKAKIGKIHQDIQSRKDAVIKDDKLSSDQKGAFLQGFERMESQEVFKVLTPEQKKEVRKRMSTLRQGAKTDLEKKKLPPKG